MKSVLLSIQPKWCELIASGKKTVEIRKTKPKIKTPFKCYIYCTKPKTKEPYEILEIHAVDKIRKANGKVVGEFICNEITRHGNLVFISRKEEIKALEGSCLTEDEFYSYMNYPPVNQCQDLKEALKKYEFYGWHISDLVIYDKPKELREFHYPDYYKTKESVYGWADEEEKSWQIKRPPQSWCYVEEEMEK